MTPPVYLTPGPLTTVWAGDFPFFVAHLPTRSPAATRTSADGPPLAEPHDASSPDPDGGTS